MKNHSVLLLVCFLFILLANGCSGKDAGALLREASSNADTLQSCNADYTSDLKFTANGAETQYKSQNQTAYRAEPFAVKSVQNTSVFGQEETQTTFTLLQDGKLWFYAGKDDAWKKTQVESMNTAATQQVDILRLLQQVKNQKYLRQEKLYGESADKIELEFNSEVLRSAAETIITASGIGKGSRTITDTLLESAPPIYGYCYISQKDHQIVRVELDAAKALNQIFQNINGLNTEISVSNYRINGTISHWNSTEKIELPPQADAAELVQAAG